MPTDLFRQNALFFYGIIVALSIEEALVRVLPHLFSGTGSTSAFTVLSLEGIRLVVFLVMAVRFYFGAVVYIQKCDEQSKGLDFLMGMFHFLLFYVWALFLPVDPTRFGGAAINGPNGEPFPPTQYYVIALLGILFYDTLWFLLSMGLRTKAHYMVRIWTLVNFFTGLAVAATYVAVKYPLDAGQWWAELWVAVIVLTASAIDLTELVQRKGIFREVFHFLYKEDDPPAGVGN